MSLLKLFRAVDDLWQVFQPLCAATSALPATGTRVNARSTWPVALSPTPSNPESPLSTCQNSNFSRYRNP